ncbi:MAG: hypothetical protein ACTSRG_24670 [Candidatus Helarchaeota archaeon]
MKKSRLFLILLLLITLGFNELIDLTENKNSNLYYILPTKEFSLFPTGQSYYSWDNNGTAICTRNGDQERPCIYSDGSGGAIIAWTDGDIYAQKINSSGHIQWAVNGTLLCNEIQTQEDVRLCSDGNGGAIIVWEDDRASNYNIYAQKINSTGYIEWGDNGTALCIASSDQVDPRICSDGAGGAYVVWEDNRDGTADIYAQYIDLNGVVQWGNGIVICNETDNQALSVICSDGVGGAILAWSDYRRGSFFHSDVYVQRINSSGNTYWTENGTGICTEDGFTSAMIEIIPDEAGGALLTWMDRRGTDYDIYAQRINSDGDGLWTPNGTKICTYEKNQYDPIACYNGSGGFIITWQDQRKKSGWEDIYVQLVDSNGNPQWDANGTVICNDSRAQMLPEICNDGAGGAIITWQDRRDLTTVDDVYAQWINSSGYTQWEANGTPVCTAMGQQWYPTICSDENGGAIITWYDQRAGDSDIYVQHIKDVEPPTSNHPDDISTSIIGLETINWTLWDRDGTGYYRVWANDSKNQYYIRENWTEWQNDTNLQVTINRTETGTYNYTIEYNNSVGLYGLPDMVIVDVTLTQNPTSNHPNNITTSVNGTETINWTLFDDVGSGKYRIWANDTNENYYIWENWTIWSNETNLEVTINRTAPGLFNYTIEYNDSTNQFGIPDSVFVNITDGMPTSNNPNNITTSAYDSNNITWIITDDYGPGHYRVWLNDSNDNYYVWVDWNSWYNDTPFEIQINRTAPGVYNYTIEYNDSNNQFGIPDILYVNVTNAIPTSNHPNNITTIANGTETIDWQLSDDFGPGQYRVWVNDTNDNYYIHVIWTTWTNASWCNITINRTAPGIFAYIIEFNDSYNLYGINDTVFVNITDLKPTCNTPGDMNTEIDSSDTIDWILYDDFGSGYYRIWVNDTTGNYYLWKNWTIWDNGSILNIELNRTALGVFNYTIEFNSSTGQISSDTVIVNITSATEHGIPPYFLLAFQKDEGIMGFLLSPFGFIIIGCVAAAAIVSAIVLKKRRGKKGKPKKLPIEWPNKKSIEP